MGNSTRLFNFAASISVVAALLLLSACKGRTMENVEADGDTIEVVINGEQGIDSLNIGSTTDSLSVK